jgi:small conductance mechanosensitive channel
MTSSETAGGIQVVQVALPVGAAVVVLLLAYLVRRIVYSRLYRQAAKTQSRWDDTIVRTTRVASLLWCIWLGIYTGLKLAEFGSGWAEGIDKAIPIVFAALGIYTVVSLIQVGLNWYSIEVAPTTKSSLDDLIIVALKWAVPLVAAILGLFLILDLAGIEVLPVNRWLAQHGGKIALLAVLGLGILLGATLAIPRVVRASVLRSRAGQTEEEVNKRVDTLSGVLTATVQVIVILVFVFMLLSEVGLNIAPVLAGVGIAGIAIGFGAQSLVKDILAGLFIIMENQYRKGDVVKIADVAGLVEDINLRRTVLRDMDGVVHNVPNGEIRVASNLTKEWSRVNLNVSVSYKTDLNHAIAVINRVGEQLAKDPQWAPSIVTPPKALRVDNLGDSGIEIKILGDTKPTKQWDVMGELRLRLKKAFDEEGIEIPWPHTKVYFGDTPLPLPKSRHETGTEPGAQE